jgi:hypothetical protein
VEAPRNMATGFSKTCRVLSAMAILAWGGASALSAQTPSPAPEMPQVERWYGHRRMRPPTPPPVPKPAEPPMRILTVKPQISFWSWFTGEPAVLQVESVAPSERTDFAQVIIGEPPRLLPQQDMALAQAVAQSTQAVVQASLQQSAPEPEAVPAQPTQVATLITGPQIPAAGAIISDQQQETLFYRMAFLQLVSTLAAFVIGPLVLVVMLRLLLRRVWTSNGHLRIELLNQPHLALVGGYPGMIPTAAPPDQKPAAKEEELEAEEVFTGEYFDMGPTFEEEKAQLEAQMRQAELALMEKIASDNVELRQQIVALGGEAAPMVEGGAMTLAPWPEEAVSAELASTNLPVMELPPEELSATVVVAPTVEPAPVSAPVLSMPQETLSAATEDAMAPALGNPQAQQTDALFSAIVNRQTRRTYRAA